MSAHVQRSGGMWVTKPFKNWKKAVEKMKAHAGSDSHSHATATLLAANRAAKHGTVVQQLQNVEARKRAQNRAAVKCPILLTHFLTKEHVAHSTKFEKLVDDVSLLVMIFPITFDGSLNQVSSDRFSNRKIRVALTELIPVCLSTRMVYLFLSCTRFLHSS